MRLGFGLLGRVRTCVSRYGWRSLWLSELRATVAGLPVKQAALFGCETAKAAHPCGYSAAPLETLCDETGLRKVSHACVSCVPPGEEFPFVDQAAVSADSSEADPRADGAGFDSAERCCLPGGEHSSVSCARSKRMRLVPV